MNAQPMENITKDNIFGGLMSWVSTANEIIN